MKNGCIAVVVAVVLASTGLMAQQTGQISGTAKDEAKTPFTDYSVRLRDIVQGQIAGSTPLDTTGAFTLPNLPTAKYLVELLNKDGKIVCTEGPFDLSQQLIKDGIIINCDKIPVAWWLLGAAGAAGITAGVVAAGPASPSR